ncbi:hypothetical protein M1329_00210 [Candidatus Marsarchaeota archaeon]|jgi:hypothetical protein|nr:hypothetical protein [Candidatus Marsarchaeota archaeon]MCL5099864.1 hypothetical protein [Candidatus Marsarchaeota archaeon]
MSEQRFAQRPSTAERADITTMLRKTAKQREMLDKIVEELELDCESAPFRSSHYREDRLVLYKAIRNELEASAFASAAAPDSAPLAETLGATSLRAKAAIVTYSELNARYVGRGKPI